MARPPAEKTLLLTSAWHLQTADNYGKLLAGSEVRRPKVNLLRQVKARRKPVTSIVRDDKD